PAKEEVTPQHVSTARAEPKLDAPTAPAKGFIAPASEPILKKLGDAVQEEVTPQHVSTARAAPKLETRLAPAECALAPADEPILKKPGDAIQDQVTPQHVFEAPSKVPEPTGGAGAPARQTVAAPAPPLEPPVRPAESSDVFLPETAAPTNGDVVFPSTEIER